MGLGREIVEAEGLVCESGSAVDAHGDTDARGRGSSYGLGA